MSMKLYCEYTLWYEFLGAIFEADKLANLNIQSKGDKLGECRCPTYCKVHSTWEIWCQWVQIWAQITQVQVFTYQNRLSQSLNSVVLHIKGISIDF